MHKPDLLWELATQHINQYLPCDCCGMPTLMLRDRDVWPRAPCLICVPDDTKILPPKAGNISANKLPVPELIIAADQHCDRDIKRRERPWYPRVGDHPHHWKA